MDPLGQTIDHGEQSVEKLADHVGAKIASQVASLLPALEGYELVIRIGLEKKA